MKTYIHENETIDQKKAFIQAEISDIKKHIRSKKRVLTLESLKKWLAEYQSELKQILDYENNYIPKLSEIEK